jgi:hypothetical protein
MQHKFGFLKGMDRDTSPDKYSYNSNAYNPNTKFTYNNYYDAMNIRIVTDDGLSTGSITNEKGNTLSFIIPETLGALYHLQYTGTTACNIRLLTSATDTTVSTAGCTNINDVFTLIISNSVVKEDIRLGRYKIYLNNSIIAIHTLSSLISLTVSVGDMITETLGSTAVAYPTILGMGTIRDWLLIFTTYSTGNANSQIWKCKYNKETEVINDLVSGYLNPGIHLVYNGDLGFSVNYRVGEVISRYEDSTHGKIYFVDALNTLKHINILDPNSLALPLSALEIIPNVSLNQPKITSIVKGGLYTSGKIQYSYQLYNLGGAETAPSPVSSLAHLTTPDDYATDTSNYGGVKAKEVTGKAVNINISNIDGNFNYLRLISIFYESKEGTPTVSVVAEVPVPQSKIVNIIDPGNTTLDVYTSSEFNGFGSALIVPKTIATKFNYLLAANIVEEYFDLDEVLTWDARAYRWGSDSSTFKIDGLWYNDTTTIPETQDCIFTEAYYADTFKYNKETGNLGGWGTNVSYEFLLTPIVIDNAPDNSIGNVALTTTKDLSQTWSTILDNTFADNASYSGYASPINEQLVGYMRGETYRFGIVVFDGKGRQSFSKWIGDIRMPDITDLDVKFTNGINHDYRTVVDFTTYSVAYVLGVQFTIANLPNGYTYKIVRARREDSDKSILGQGVLGWTIKENNENIAYAQQFPLYFDGDGVTIKYSDTAGNLLNPSLGKNGGNGDFYEHMVLFKSPEVSFLNSIKPINGDSIKLVEDTGTHFDVTKVLLGGDNWKTTFVGKIKGFNPITSQQILTVRDGIKSSQSFNKDLLYNIPNYGTCTQFTNTPWRCNKGIPKGNNLALGLEESTTLTSKITSSGASGLVIANYIKDVSLARYGGNTYYQRINTIYISCGNTHKTNDFTGTTSVSKVYGGDTYITFFDYLDKTFNRNGDLGSVNTDWVDTYVLLIPLESTVNCELRGDTCYTRGGNSFKLSETVADGNINYPSGNDYGAYPSTFTDLYQYNSAYSADGQIKTFTPRPLYFVNRKENDYRIIASEQHVNGQTVDNWTKFLFGNYIEVNSAYGSINKLIAHANNILFFQDNAYGLVSVNERQLLKDDSGASLVLGTGGVLDAYRYISEKAGTKSQYSVIDTGNVLYFYDLNNRKLMQYSGGQDQQISDVKGMSSYFSTFDYGSTLVTDEPQTSKGIHGIFDPINKRLLYTILGNTADTFGYNMFLDVFESRYGFHPSLYQDLDGEIFSVNLSNQDRVYIHGKGNRGNFYGGVQSSFITLLANPEPDVKKVFTNLEFNSLVASDSVEYPANTLTGIEMWNNHQYTGYITLNNITNIRRRFRTWRYQVPKVSGNRLLDYHLFIKLYYNNTGATENTTFRLDDVTVHTLVPMI